MTHKIEKKIQNFINETEISNLVAPELNVDRDRDEWLRKQGKLSEGPTNVKDAADRILDIGVKYVSSKNENSWWEEYDGNYNSVKEFLNNIKKYIPTNKWNAFLKDVSRFTKIGEGREMQAGGIFESRMLDQDIVDNIIEIAAKFSTSKEIWDERDVEHRTVKELLQSIKSTGFIPTSKWNTFVQKVSSQYKDKK